MAHQKSILLVLVAAAAVTVAVDTDAIDNRKADFDYFYLVRQWPATFCNQHACTHAPPTKYRFTVHGLWPQRRDGTWPEFCDPDDELDEQKIWDLLPDLERVWPSWFSDDETFWNHEWTRHGTCARRIMHSQHEFFYQVLRLHKKLNIQDALESAGIEPSNSRAYRAQDIKDAIDDEYGVMPHITCDGQGELSEVWMCINKKLQPIDCADGPHPHRAVAAAGASNPTPANFNCNMVKIPKNRGRRADDVALAGSTEEQTAEHTSGSGKHAEAEVDVASAVETVVEAAVELEQQQPASVAAKDAVVEAATAAALAAARQPASASGNQHLPLLVAVAVLVVAALVVAAAVVLQLVQWATANKSSSQDGAGYAVLPYVDAEGSPSLKATNGDVSV